MPINRLPSICRVPSLLLCLAGLLGGCATERPRTAEPIERLQVLTEIGNGQLRLTCGASCSATWRLSKEKFKGLYNSKVWQDLAVAVAHVGYESDLAYFYLGRAAEETGTPKAAEIYFRLSMASTTKCNGWIFNSCDGTNPPVESAAALARLASK